MDKNRSCFLFVALAEKRGKSTTISAYVQVLDAKGLKRTLDIWDKSSNFARKSNKEKAQKLYIIL